MERKLSILDANSRTTKRIGDKTMTREEAKELLPIIQAFAAGKQIQDSIDCVRWFDTDKINLEYEGQKIKHRIKPEPKYRPFKTQEECWEEMHKHLDFGWIRYGDFICTIQMIAPDGIAISDGLETNNFDFKECFMNTKFVDNTPFGIKEQ